MTPWPNDWPTPDALQRLAREIVAGDDGVEFVFGHAVIQALRSPPRHSSNLLGWFRSTMTRARIDWLRSPEFRGQDDLHEGDDGFLFDALAQESEPEEMDRAELAEVMEFLNSEVNALSPRDREIVHLDFWEGLSIIEIAARLDVSESTVLRTKRRVLESMRETVGAEPERNGRTLLALAGVPARLWKREAATVAAVGVGPLALLIAAVVALFAFVMVEAVGRDSRDTADVSVARLHSAGDDLASASDAGAGLTEPARSPRVMVKSPVAVEERSGITQGSGDASGPDFMVEDAAQATQSFALTVRNWGEPLTGLEHEAWSYDAGGKIISALSREASPGDAAAGVYRFELPDLPVVWQFSVADKERRVWLELKRQLSDIPLAETVDLELVGRSFSFAPGTGERFPKYTDSPWLRIVGVKTLRPATWLMCAPRLPGKVVDQLGFAHPYDGILHFEAAARLDMTFSYKDVRVDPSGLVPLDGFEEVKYAPPSPEAETEGGESFVTTGADESRVAESLEDGG